MATHQEIGGLSDAELLQRMVTSHAERYGEAFWKFFLTQITPRLPPQPVMVDLGCGPGLFLRDLSTHYPQARLHGYDITPAMIAYAQREVIYAGASPTLAVHDLSAQPLPLPDHSVHLIAMTAVLHVLDDPLSVLAEIHRVLAPQGIFFLNDWVRTSLQEYLESRTAMTGETLDERRLGWFRLFPIHNKYTADDWQWLLREGKFAVQAQTRLRPHFRIFVTTPMLP